MGGAVPVLAGTVSTLIFAGSVLPMLRKAAVTKDLASYSLGNIMLANVGNVVHSLYVVHLPMGPVWALHGFYLVSSALMLFWYLRFRGRGGGAELHPPTHGAGHEIRLLSDAAAGRRPSGSESSTSARWRKP
jgi:hypothetical protein